MSWILETNQGQQVWKVDRNRPAVDFPFDRSNPNAADLVYRHQVKDKFKEIDLKEALKNEHLPSLPSNDKLAQQALSTVIKGVNFYQTLQMDDGHWPGDYGGPLFLMPGTVITCYVTGHELRSEQKLEMIKYLSNHQHDDGGWGIHIESRSTMFGTVMNYVCLRLLGVPADDSRAMKARLFILSNGGAQGLPSWGKFWLSVLGVYSWDGCNSIFPEFWTLPEFLPIHPWRWWCHCRMVYLPMAYAYGARIIGPETDLVRELREELYTKRYADMKWNEHRSEVAKIDLYTPQTTILKVLNTIVNIYEKCPLGFLRKRALNFILDYINAEDDQTNYIDIGPVNKFINMLCVWHAYGSNDKRFKLHQSRVDDYLWIAEDGMKVQGYNGSQLWDTAFAVQAITESGVSHLFQNCLKKAYQYVDCAQVLEDVKDRVKFYRHISKGGWPFSTRAHGWPIADCTAEGLKATIALHDPEAGLFSSYDDKSIIINRQRQEDAINVILSFQNDDGGWATYENTRGPSWLEYINPAEVFGGIMIDYSYVELSSACIQAMCKFRKVYPNHRAKEIQRAIDRGIEFIKEKQRPDGSFYGSWAVCFCYGAWFAAEAFIDAGYKYNNSSVLQKLCQFLVKQQLADGGWGESYLSCVDKEYRSLKRSQVINTAWSLLALLKCDYHLIDRKPIDAAIKFLISSQESNGDFPQQEISGVFNNNCMITYTNYRNIFPIWALGRYVSKLKKE